MGKPVDKRSDIFSFGVLVYECLTGVCPYAENPLLSVLADDADLDMLPGATPARVRRVLRRCLDRDKQKRYRDMGDVALDLLAEEDDAAPGVAEAVAASRWGVWRALGAFVVVSVAAVAGALWLAPREDGGPAPGVKRFGVGGFTMPVDTFMSVALSPGGEHLVVRGKGEDGWVRLFVRPLGSLSVQPLAGSEWGWLPFFSPDGEEVAFFASGEVKSVSVRGGAARVLCHAERYTGGAWLHDGTIVFTAPGETLFYEVSASGGEARALRASASGGIDIAVAPAPVPGRRAVLCAVRRDGRFDIGVFSLDDGTLRIVAENGLQPVYAPTGHVVYQQGQDGPLMAVPFDRDRLRATGRAFPVIPDIGTRSSFQAQMYALSNDGTLAIFPPFITHDAGTIVWVDRSGRAHPIVEIDRTIDLPRLSNDERRVAFRTPGPNCDIWVHEFARGSTTRITRDGDNHGVWWSADDRHIYTVRRALVAGAAARLRSDGSGEPQTLHADIANANFLAGVSRDGATALLAMSRPNTGWDVDVLDVASGRIEPLLGTRSDEIGAALSPDGTLLAYVSNETARPEVYLTPFPSRESRVLVSGAGGSEPVWSRDGTRLYFRRAEIMLAVDVQREPSLVVARPVEVFRGSFALGSGGLAGYDVSADGERFVMVRHGRTDVWPMNVEVVLNWFVELERLGGRTGGR